MKEIIDDLIYIRKVTDDIQMKAPWWTKISPYLYARWFIKKLRKERKEYIRSQTNEKIRPNNRQL